MRKSPFFFTLLCSAIVSVLFVSCNPTNKQAKFITLTVYASDSLKSALTDIKTIYNQDYPNINIKYKLANSGTLEKLIEEGARGDILIPSKAKVLDNLQSKNFLLAGTRQNFLKNQIVLIVSKDTQNISDFKDLTHQQIQKIALGDNIQEASGKYASEIFVKLGILEQVKIKFVFMSKNSEILSFVENGKANAGLVYATDAILSKGVKIVTLAPQGLHSPIVYPIAILKTSPHISEARNFIQFLQSDRAEAVFLKYRFVVNSNISN
ncbi:molybdate ABC transporter substrate-binding protein [Scytonema sp. UIC 10036]|uniref:molybdate ABC transporter substrate-binding protein n=1 Tax=Scytonema sp. UIC 10036 TaxID=2304196 RepID=UPI0012DA0E9C|nr:molybdate ABC transporter substrate-binding protein [Scytonema sp. UIC 10036]MUH01410.1 molybdate ABC transporter substrate-binding protein [Scytonema sp. UIC 10036]